MNLNSNTGHYAWLKIKKGFIRNLFNLLVYLILLDFAFVFLFPYIYMTVTSLKSPIQLLDMLAKWIPRELHWDNYTLAVKGLDFGRSFGNSLIVTVLSTIGHVFSASLVAYGFARFRFPGKNILFSIVLFTLIVPAQTVIVPLFIQFNRMRLLDTYFPLILPTYLGVGLRGGLFIFIFRQFFLGVPYELEEAARIDGVSDLGIYFRIVLPISMSAVLVTSILSIVWHWNDFFEPMMYLKTKGKFLLPMMLPNLTFNLESYMQVADNVNKGVIMAGTFLSVMPILVVYLILQRHFVQSIARTGLTGM
ncbi:MAG: carbohydrate ABC transporter permease [Spirochaetales bacterium]|nr:carbohydrate ABC transporter permease [Spirochaetales bacterium]